MRGDASSSPRCPLAARAHEHTQERHNATKMMQAHKPRLAIMGTDIRRDNVAPLAYFRRVHVIYFYRRATYGDLGPEDFSDVLVHYQRLSELAAKIHNCKPDVLLSNEPFRLRLLPYTVLAYALSLWLPLMISTGQNRPFHEMYGGLTAAILRPFLSIYFRRATLLVYRNEGTRKNLLWAEAPAERLRWYLGTGVDPNEFTPVRDGREPDFGGWPVVMFVGRLCEEKGVFDLIEAFRYVQSKLPHARLVFIGDGPARAQIELTAGKSIHVLGTIKNRDLPPYFRVATVIASPSKTTRKWEEIVGMVNIQAMACGAPVVSTRSGAIPEYVPEGRAGLLVPEGSPSDLADAILRLCIDRQLHDAMGQFGRKYCLERYVMADNVSAFEDAVLEVCALSGSGSRKEHSG